MIGEELGCRDGIGGLVFSSANRPSFFFSGTEHVMGIIIAVY